MANEADVDIFFFFIEKPVLKNFQVPEIARCSSSSAVNALYKFLLST